MDRSSRQNNEGKNGLEQHYRQNGPNKLYRTSMQQYQYTFSSTHRTFSSIDHMLSHKISLNKFQKIYIIQNNFNYNGMKLEMNNKEKLKIHSRLKLNSILLNNHWVREKSKGKLKSIL